MANRKIVILSAIDDPDPFSPNGDGVRDTSTLSARFAARLSDGLESLDHRSDRSRQFEFFIRWRWLIRDRTGLVRWFEQDTPVQPPFERVVLPTEEGLEPYAVVSANQVFDGRDSRADLLPEGTYPYFVEAEYWRWKLDGTGRAVTLRARSGDDQKPKDNGKDDDKAKDKDGGGDKPDGAGGEQEKDKSDSSDGDKHDDGPGKDTDRDKGDKSGGKPGDKPDVPNHPSRGRGELKLIGVARPVRGDITISLKVLVLVVTAPADGTITREAQIVVSGTVTEVPGVAATVNGAPVAIQNGAFSTAIGLVEESNTITIVAVDAIGTRLTETRTVVRDSIPPTVTVASPAAGSFVNQKTPQVRVTYNDSGSGVAVGTVRIVIGGVDRTELFTVGATEAVLKPGVSLDLPDGEIRIDARVEDVVGNVGQASATFFVDTVPPAISLSPADGAVVADPKPTFTASYSDPTPSSGFNLASFVATLDGQDVSGSFTVGTLSATFTPSTALAQGTHTLTVHIRDQSGNSATATSIFFIDSVAPTISLSPSSGSFVTTGTPTLVAGYWDSSPSSGIDISSFAGLLDGLDASASFAVSTSSATYVTPDSNPLCDGDHVFEARISDRAGHLAQATTRFGVDTKAPLLSITSPADGSTLMSGTPLVQVAFSDPSPGSGIAVATFHASLDQTSITSSFTVSDTGATFQIPSSSPLTTGPHQLSIDIADRAGNRAAAQVRFTVFPPPAGPQGSIVGEIRMGDPCDSRPLSGASVRLLRAAGQVVTDPQGRFVLRAPVGLAWLEIRKVGFLYVQRSCVVVEGQETVMPTVFLAAEDSRVSHVVAAQGGSITDSTGEAILDIPPGALPGDMDVRLTLITDKKASKGPPLRNFIPRAAVRITPDRVVLNAPVTVRVKNVVRMPVHPIQSFDWNSDTQVWERTVDAVITPDGEFFQSTISSFSGAAPG